MAIEDTLERIAIALEAIARHKLEAPLFPAEEPKAEPPRTRPGKKVEAVKEEPVAEVETQEEDFTEDTSADIKFADIKDAWFSMLSEVKEARGMPEAQAAAKKLMGEFCGGQRFGEAVIDKAKYAEFLAAIQAEASNG